MLLFSLVLVNIDWINTFSPGYLNNKSKKCENWHFAALLLQLTERRKAEKHLLKGLLLKYWTSAEKCYFRHE